jgi:hypothetical protein
MSKSNVTEAIMLRGLELGLTPDRIEFLMKVADVPNFNKIDTNRPDSIQMIKPDPDGVFYMKLSVAGRWIVKPLHNDEVKAKAIMAKKLKELNINQG